MKKILLATSMAVSMVYSAAVLAQTPNNTSTDQAESYWTDKPRAYFGVGVYDQGFDDIQVSGYTLNTKTAFGFSLGYIRQWKPNIDIDWSGNANFSTGDKVDSGICSTDNGGFVSCNIKSNNVVLSMPVVMNFRHDVSNDFALYAGLGGALNYVSRGAEARADGYQSDTIDDETSVSISPVVQLGLMIHRVRINLARNIGLGDSDVGDGDVTSLSLEYFFGRVRR